MSSRLSYYKYRGYVFLILKSVFIILLIGFTIDKTAMFYLISQKKFLENLPSKNTPCKKDILRIRESLFFNFNRPYSLLKSYEQDKFSLSITNPGKNKIVISPCEIFFTFNKIKGMININEGDASAIKVKKIYDFVRSLDLRNFPLFRGDILHSPLIFLNAFGVGCCDDWALNFATLAALYGFESRIWELKGHVVAEIKYNDSWHVFDSFSSEIESLYDEKGNVPDVPTMVDLARKRKLSRHGYEYKTVEDNTFYLLPEIKKEIPPYLNFFPGEKKLFFSHAFVLNTDGKQFEKYSFFNSYYFTIYETIANLIREIPLDYPVPSDEMIIKDYFPFVGVFIVLPENSFISKDEFPIIDMESEYLPVKISIPACPFDKKGLNKNYLNLSIAVKNFETNPSFSIHLKNLNRLICRYKGIKLLTFHYYCHTNAQFDESHLKDLTEKGLAVFDKRERREKGL